MMKTATHLRFWLLLAMFGLLVTLAVRADGFLAHLFSKPTPQADKDDFAAYLGAAWGPDGDTIYCMKLLSTPKAGRQYWLCKMKWDGSEKEEICELWPGQDAIVDTQSGPVWMEVNAATSNIAFSVEYGNEGSGGLWIVGLDGKKLHRPFPLVWNEKAKWAPLHPSWSPDGTKIVFEEDDRTAPTSSVRRLVLYNLQKRNRRSLTDGPCDQHPMWSPKGDWIVFSHNLYDKADREYSDRRIWLIRPDGSEQKPVVDEKGKPIFGWWPSWNPGADKIGITDDCLRIANLQSHKNEYIDPLPILGERIPWTFMGHQWGKHGWLLTYGAIRFIYPEILSGRFLARGGAGRWGDAPQDIPRRESK